jgi:hypothetical protein
MWQKKRIEERVLDAGAGCFAYDYERVGHFGRCAWSWRCWRKGGLRRLLAGQSGINPAAELLVESPALWEGGLQNLFDLETASSFVAGRGLLCRLARQWALARTQSKIATVVLPGLRHHRPAPVSCLFSATGRLLQSSYPGHRDSDCHVL